MRIFWTHFSLRKLKRLTRILPVGYVFQKLVLILLLIEIEALHGCFHSLTTGLLLSSSRGLLFLKTRKRRESTSLTVTLVCNSIRI